MPGFPLAPLIFIVAGVYVVVGSVASNPANAVKGAALILLGVPVFLFWDGRRRAEKADRADRADG
jgi:APA family basic amino acid/polyamine antiporter